MVLEPRLLPGGAHGDEWSPSRSVMAELAEPSDLPSRIPDPGPPSPKRPRGTLVEFARLIIVILFAVGGWEVASSMAENRAFVLVLAIVIGSGVGYVVGGAFGRRTATAISQVERELSRVPAGDLLASAIGLSLGLFVAVLISLPLFHIPPAAAWPSVAFLFLTMGYAGASIGRSKSDELFGLFGVKPKAAGTSVGEIAVLDSSAILDGRMLALVQMGFLRGTLLVAREVLDELQVIADASDPVLRERGRRGLDLLVALKRDPSVDLALVEDPRIVGEPVDARLVRLARTRGAVLVTNDAPLAKLAAALEVPVRSIHALAEALRTPILPGERISLRLTRRGREHGQGIGYTEDGTMVVVEEAERLVGQTVPVALTNMIQTSTGHLAFAKLLPEPSA